MLIISRISGPKRATLLTREDGLFLNPKSLVPQTHKI